MGRWLGGLFLLLSLCVLAIVLARTGAYARARPPDAQALFTTPDGRPCDGLCLFGIFPGKTTEAEATAILGIHPLTQAFDIVGTQPFRIEGHNDWIVMISFNTTPQGLVDEITLARYIRYSRPQGDKTVLLPDPGTLGDALSRFGRPDFVQLTRGGDPSLIFANAGVIANLVRTHGGIDRIVFRQPLSRLTVFRRGACDKTTFPYAFLPWLGTAHLSRYSTAYAVRHNVRPMSSASATFAPCR